MVHYIYFWSTLTNPKTVFFSVSLAMWKPNERAVFACNGSAFFGPLNEHMCAVDYSLIFYIFGGNFFLLKKNRNTRAEKKESSVFYFLVEVFLIKKIVIHGHSYKVEWSVLHAPLFFRLR